MLASGASASADGGRRSACNSCLSFEISESFAWSRCRACRSAMLVDGELPEGASALRRKHAPLAIPHLWQAFRSPKFRKAAPSAPVHILQHQASADLDAAESSLRRCWLPRLRPGFGIASSQAWTLAGIRLPWCPCSWFAAQSTLRSRLADSTAEGQMRSCRSSNRSRGRATCRAACNL